MSNSLPLARVAVMRWSGLSLQSRRLRRQIPGSAQTVLGVVESLNQIVGRHPFAFRHVGQLLERWVREPDVILDFLEVESQAGKSIRDQSDGPGHGVGHDEVACRVR